jgi:hypothetical protein
VTAEGTEIPTCCCGRRFIRGLTPAEARAEAVRRLRDAEAVPQDSDSHAGIQQSPVESEDTEVRSSVTDFETSEAPTIDEVDRVAQWLGVPGHVLIEWKRGDLGELGNAYHVGYRDGQAAAVSQNRPGGLILAIAVVVALGLGTLGGWLVRDAQQAYCPSEDSCTADYRDGAWHVEQVQP